jgi:hypothetical protein
LYLNHNPPPKNVNEKKHKKSLIILQLYKDLPILINIKIIANKEGILEKAI